RRRATQSNTNTSKFLHITKDITGCGRVLPSRIPGYKNRVSTTIPTDIPLTNVSENLQHFHWLLIASCIGQEVSLGFVCMPLRSLWDATVPGRCFDRLAWWFVGSSISLVTDVVIVIMPLPLLRTIKLPWRQKAVLMATFALGFFTCAISIVRITILQTSSTLIDATYDTTIVGIWSITELSCAIVCVCVPTLRPLLKRKNPRILPPLVWLRPKIDDGGTTESFTQSDVGGLSGQRKRSGARSGLQLAAPQVYVIEQARNSGAHNIRSLPQKDLNDVSGMPLPPAVHLTPSEAHPLQISLCKDAMVPPSICDTEDGVEFLDSAVPEPEEPSPLSPPPRQHSSMTPSQADDGYFEVVVWDASGQPRLPASPGSASSARQGCGTAL
ncbi:hypothetical protein LY76DRAFT_657313, partial [Colletotrichum caudatum]